MDRVHSIDMCGVTSGPAPVSEPKARGRDKSNQRAASRRHESDTNGRVDQHQPEPKARGQHEAREPVYEQPTRIGQSRVVRHVGTSTSPEPEARGQYESSGPVNDRPAAGTSPTRGDKRTSTSYGSRGTRPVRAQETHCTSTWKIQRHRHESGRVHVRRPGELPTGAGGA